MSNFEFRINDHPVCWDFISTYKLHLDMIVLLHGFQCLGCRACCGLLGFLHCSWRGDAAGGVTLGLCLSLSIARVKCVSCACTYPPTYLPYILYCTFAFPCLSVCLLCLRVPLRVFTLLLLLFVPLHVFCFCLSHCVSLLHFCFYLSLCMSSGSCLLEIRLNI